MEEDYSQPTQPTQPEVPKPQEGISTVTGILITLLAAALIGAGIWYYYAYVVSPDLDKSATTTTTPTKTETDETKDWKTLTFNYSKGTLKYPTEWGAVKEIKEIGDGISTYYYVDTNGGIPSEKEYNGQIYEYNITEWLKGPKEEGYNLNKSDREKAIALMKEIYNEQKLTDEIKEKLTEFSLEFFPYNSKNAIDWKYFESKDGKSRGFSVMNIQGQDMPISPMYLVSLYNSEKNIVISIDLTISETSEEVKELNDKLEDSSGKQVANIETIYKQNQAGFKKLVEGSKRADLSFGDLMDKADLAMKSLTF